MQILSPRWMAVKAGLFLLLALSAAFFVLRRDPSWGVAACLVAIAWACSRAYYFAFYVVEHYVDRSFRFTGLVDFVRWWMRRQNPNP